MHVGTLSIQVTEAIGLGVSIERRKSPRLEAWNTNM